MPAPTEAAIYANYRNALRTLTRAARSSSGDRNTRISQCRQIARKMTVERYNISYRDLKDIIDCQDELKGITHLSGKDMDLLDFNTQHEGVTACPRCGGTKYLAGRENPLYLGIDELADPFIFTCISCYADDTEEHSAR